MSNTKAYILEFSDKARGGKILFWSKFVNTHIKPGKL